MTPEVSSAVSSPVAAPGSLKAWMLAIRPKTLAAGVVPVVVGTALAFGEGVGRWLPALAALVGALLIQIGTNFTNDYYDFKKGADTHERLGPTRVTQSGLIAPNTVFAAAMLTFAAAFAVGIYLVAIAGWPIVIIGLLSLLFGWAYTGGPYPLGYNGLGDLFVFIFFGIVAVGGTYYVQALSLPPVALLAGIPAGALATALLAVNNLRDVETDTRAGKRTLVVRLGVPAGKGEYVLLTALAFLTPLALFALGYASAWALLPLLALPLAVSPVRIVLTKAGAPLNAALGGTARLLFVHGVLFSVGLFLGSR